MLHPPTRAITFTEDPTDQKRLSLLTLFMRSACWAALECVQCLLKHQHVYIFASYPTMSTHARQWEVRRNMHVGFRQRETHGNVLLRPAADRIQGTTFPMKSNEGLSSIAHCWEVDEDECCGRALHGATRCTQGVAPPTGLSDDGDTPLVCS